MKFGWIREPADHIAHKRRLVMPMGVAATPLPARVDWRFALPPCYDQGGLGSCTAQALAAAAEYLRLTTTRPSRLFIYWNERDLESSTQSDDGAMIIDGVLSLVTQGVCAETLWPYVESQFDQRPPNSCYVLAERSELLNYARVDNTSLDDLLFAIGQGPVVGGYDVFESFMSPHVAESGVAFLPEAGEKPVGGHAILVVGYDRATSRFLVRNSWGTDWGTNGYFTIPFAYFTDAELASDFWLLKTIE